MINGVHHLWDFFDWEFVFLSEANTSPRSLVYSG